MTIDNKFTRNKRKSNNHLPQQKPPNQKVVLGQKMMLLSYQGQPGQPGQFQGQPAHFQGQPQFQGQPGQFQGPPGQYQGQPGQYQGQASKPRSPNPNEFHKNQGTYYFPNGEIFRPRISPARRNRPSKINYVPQVNNRPPMGQSRDVTQQRHEQSPGGPIRNKSFPVPSSTHPELPRSQSSSNVKTQMFQQHLNHQMQMNQPGKLPQQYSSQYQQFQNLQGQGQPHSGHPHGQHPQYPSPHPNQNHFQAPNGILPYEAYQQLSNNSSSTSLKNLQSNNLIKSSMNNSDPSLKKSTSSERSTTNTPRTSITNSIDEKYVEILRDDFDDIKEVSEKTPEVKIPEIKSPIKTPEPRSVEEFSTPTTEVFVTPDSSPVQSKISLDEVIRKNEEMHELVQKELAEQLVEESEVEGAPPREAPSLVAPSSEEAPSLAVQQQVEAEPTPEPMRQSLEQTLPILNDYPAHDSTESSPNSLPESSPSPHSVEQVILLTPKKEFRNDQSSSSTVKSFPSPSSSQSYDDDLINEYRESPIKPSNYKSQTFIDTDEKVEREYTKLLEDEQQVPKRGDINFYEDRITKHTRVSLNSYKEEDDLPLPTIKYSDKELKLPKTPVDRDVESTSSVEDVVKPDLMPVETESVYSDDSYAEGDEVILTEDVPGAAGQEAVVPDTVVPETVAPETVAPEEAVVTEKVSEKEVDVPEIEGTETEEPLVASPVEAVQKPVEVNGPVQVSETSQPKEVTESTVDSKTEQAAIVPPKPKSMLDVVDKPAAKPKSMLDVVDVNPKVKDVKPKDTKQDTKSSKITDKSTKSPTPVKDSPKTKSDFKEKFKSKDIPLNLKLSPKKLNSISRLRKKPPSSSPLIERFLDQKKEEQKKESKLDLFLLPETSQKSKSDDTQKSNSEKSLPSVPESKTSKWKKVFKKSEEEDSKSIHSESSKKDLKEKLKKLKRSFSYKNLRLKKEEQPPLPDLSFEPDNLTSLEVLSSPENNLYSNLDDMDVVLPTIETDDNLFDDMLHQFDEKMETVGRKNTIKPVKLIDPFLKDDELTKDQIKDQQIMDEEILTHHKNLSDEYIDDNLKYLKDEFVYLDNDMKSFNEVKSITSEHEEEQLIGGAEDSFTIDNEQLNNLFNNINDSQKRILPMHLRYIKQFKDFQQLEIKTKKFEILTQRAKKPEILTVEPAISKRTKTSSNKRVQFSHKIFVNETFSPDTYSRYNKKVTQYTLTEPVEIARIKNELNDYKCNEMLVHERSQNNTHFFY